MLFFQVELIQVKSCSALMFLIIFHDLFFVLIIKIDRDTHD
jgi:hypothetical protein